MAAMTHRHLLVVALMLLPAVVATTTINAPAAVPTLQNKTMSLQRDFFNAVTVESSDAVVNLTLTVHPGNVALVSAPSAGLHTPASRLDLSGSPPNLTAGLEPLLVRPEEDFVGRLTISLATASAFANITAYVHAALNQTASRAQLLAGVDTVYAHKDPGGLLLLPGTAAFSLLYTLDGPGSGPLIAASTLGAGRVVAMGVSPTPSFGQELSSDPLFYHNTIKWLADQPNDTNTTITVGCTDASLCANLGAAVANLSTTVGTLAAITTPGAVDVFFGGHLDPTLLPGEDVARIISFTASGGGLLIADSYKEYAPAVPLSAINGNTICRLAGIGFSSVVVDSTEETHTPTNHSVIVDQDSLVNLLERSIASSSLEWASATHVLNAVAAEDCFLNTTTDGMYKYFAARLTSRVYNQNLTEDDALRYNSTVTHEQHVHATWWEALVRLPATETVAHPKAAALFGSVASAPRGNISRAIDPAVPRWHTTAGYVAPGEVATVVVPPAALSAIPGMRVWVSADTHVPKATKEWGRPPRIARSYPVEGEETRVAGAFGGMVYVDVGAKPRPDVAVWTVTVTNAVRAPVFKLGVHDDAYWEVEKHQPAPQAVLVGPNLMLSLPSVDAASVDAMEDKLGFWDAAASAMDTVLNVTHLRQGPQHWNIDYLDPDAHQITTEPFQSIYPPTDDVWNFLVHMGRAHRYRPDSSWGRSFYRPDGDGSKNLGDLLAVYVSETLAGHIDSEFFFLEFPCPTMNVARQVTTFGKKNQDDIAVMAVVFRTFGWELLTKMAMEANIASDAGNKPVKGTATGRDTTFASMCNNTGYNLAPFLVDRAGLGVSENFTLAFDALPAFMPAVACVTGPLECPPGYNFELATRDLDTVASVESTHSAVTSTNGTGVLACPDEPATVPFSVVSSAGFMANLSVAVTPKLWGVLLEWWLFGESPYSLDDMLYDTPPDRVTVPTGFHLPTNNMQAFNTRWRAFVTFPPDVTTIALHLASNDEARLTVGGNTTQLFSTYAPASHGYTAVSAPFNIDAGQAIHVEVVHRQEFKLAHMSVGFSTGDPSQPRLLSGDSGVVLRPHRAFNTAPTVVNDTTTLVPGVAGAVSVLANDFDLDGDTLFVVLMLDPVPPGAANVTHNGSHIAVAPHPSFTGLVTVSYWVADGFGGKVAANLRASVAPAAPKPTPLPPPPPPVALDAPTVTPVISGPQLVGPCDAFDLDASLTFVTVNKSLPGNTILVKYVWTANDTFSLPPESKRRSPFLRLLDTAVGAGAAVAFTVTVTATHTATGSSASRTASASIVVGRSSQPVPSLSIIGPAAYTLLPTLPLEVTAIAALAGCSDDDRAVKLGFQWSVAGVTDHVSTSRAAQLPAAGAILSKQRVLRLEAGALPSGATYVLHVRAFPETSPTDFNTAALQVQVEAVGVDVHLDPEPRAVSTQLPLTLNASLSSDGDGLGRPLTFAWSCRLEGTACSSTVLPTAHSAPVVVIPANTLAQGVYTFSVEVVAVASGDATSARASKSVDIQAVGVPAASPAPGSTPVSVTFPDVSISAPALWVTSSRLKVTGSITHPSSTTATALSARWEASNGASDAVVAAAAATSVPALDTEPMVTIIALFDAGTQPPGVAFTLRLLVTVDSDGTPLELWASTTVAVASVPGGGQVTVEPKAGVAGITGFTIGNTGWSDASSSVLHYRAMAIDYTALVSGDALPSFHSDSRLRPSRRWPLSPRQASNVVSDMVLPLPDSESHIGVYTEVWNHLGAAALSNITWLELTAPGAADVAVLITGDNTTAQAEALTSRLAASAEAAVAVDDPFASVQAVSSAASLLSALGCDGYDCNAGTCVALATGPSCNCSATSMTGPYCEQVTASNSTADPAEASTPMNTASLTLKRCPSKSAHDCSGHGTCVSSSAVWCRAGSTTCAVACECATGFSGRDCSLTHADEEAHRELKRHAFQSLTAVANSPSSTTDALTSATSALAALLTTSPTAISEEDTAYALEFTELLAATTNVSAGATPDSSWVETSSWVLSVLGVVGAARVEDALTSQGGARRLAEATTQTVVERVGCVVDALKATALVEGSLLQAQGGDISVSVVLSSTAAPTQSMSMGGGGWVTLPDAVYESDGEAVAVVEWGFDPFLGVTGGLPGLGSDASAMSGITQVDVGREVDNLVSPAEVWLPVGVEDSVAPGCMYLNEAGEWTSRGVVWLGHRVSRAGVLVQGCATAHLSTFAVGGSSSFQVEFNKVSPLGDAGRLKQFADERNLMPSALLLFSIVAFGVWFAVAVRRDDGTTDKVARSMYVKTGSLRATRSLAALAASFGEPAAGTVPLVEQHEMPGEHGVRVMPEAAVSHQEVLDLHCRFVVGLDSVTARENLLRVVLGHVGKLFHAMMNSEHLLVSVMKAPPEALVQLTKPQRVWILACVFFTSLMVTALMFGRNPSHIHGRLLAGLVAALFIAPVRTLLPLMFKMVNLPASVRNQRITIWGATKKVANVTLPARRPPSGVKPPRRASTALSPKQAALRPPVPPGTMSAVGDSLRSLTLEDTGHRPDRRKSVGPVRGMAQNQKAAAVLASAPPFMTTAEHLVGVAVAHLRPLRRRDAKDRSVAVVVDRHLPIVASLLAVSLIAVAAVQAFATILLAATDSSLPTSELLHHTAPLGLLMVGTAAFATLAFALCGRGAYGLAVVSYGAGLACHAALVAMMSSAPLHRSSVVAAGIVVLHVVILVICGSFGWVWIRSVRKFRSSLQFRRQRLAHLMKVVNGLNPLQLAKVEMHVTTLQNAFRRFLGRSHARRRADINAWQGLVRPRWHVLALVYCTSGLYLLLATYFVLVFSVKFSPELAQAWLLASMAAFAMDICVYHTLGLLVKALVEFLVLVSKGITRSTLAKGAGKLTEQIRWLCSDFYM